MSSAATKSTLEFVASAYFAGNFVQCETERAWRILLNYTAWNPTFVGAIVTPIEGTPSTEGELVLVTVPKDIAYKEREDFPSYFVRTIKVVPGRRIVWYCYAKDKMTFHNQEDPFRNFVDFSIVPEGSGTRFDCYYYQQARLSDELVAKERQFMPQMLQSMADAFRDYCQNAK